MAGHSSRTGTPVALGLFFAFATAMCVLAGLSLLAAGGPLDAIWRWKPDEFAQLRALGSRVGFGFLALAMVMAAASYGAFGRRRWGWWLAVGIFLVNALGDAARIPFGAVGEGVIGVVVTGVILWWLTRSSVRRAFTQ